MSVINRMLLDLERRGACLEDAPGEDGVRPVPAPRRRPWGIAIAGALLLVAAAALAAVRPWLMADRSPPQTVASGDPVALREIAAPISGAPAPAPAPRHRETPQPSDPEVLLPPPASPELPAGKSPALNPVAAAKSSPAPGTVAPSRAPARAAAATREGAGGGSAAPKPDAPASVGDSAPGIRIDKRMKEFTPRQQAEGEFRRAVGLTRQGRIEEARAALHSALRLDPGYGIARQMLAALLVEANQMAEAETVLAEALQEAPADPGVAMALARIQVSRGALDEALATLRKAEAAGASSAEYQAFVATVLQRLSRHDEAIVRYAAALQAAPNSGVWLMGIGISLQAEGRYGEAREAFRRARDAENLSPELIAFVDQRLRSLPAR